MKRAALLLLCLAASPLIQAEDVLDAPPGYKEVPYYLRKLEETKLEDERVKFNKLVHDGIVFANLSDKKVVKEMEPIVDKVRRAMDSQLDRVNIGGQQGWLESAVNYFDQEKLRPIVAIPESDWLPSQSSSQNGKTLSTYPDRIMVHEGPRSEEVVKSSEIHEAVISSDGKNLAFYRLVSPKEERAEIWVTRLEKDKSKKIATVPSCFTLIFSRDGGKIYFQEKAAKPGQESNIYVVSASGGKPKLLTKGTVLETVVQNGKYRDSVIVYKKMLHHLGTSSRSCASAVSASGHDIGRLLDGPCQ